jgi:hypothetical protein
MDTDIMMRQVDGLCLVISLQTLVHFAIYATEDDHPSVANERRKDCKQKVKFRHNLPAFRYLVSQKGHEPLRHLNYISTVPENRAAGNCKV